MSKNDDVLFKVKNFDLVEHYVVSTVNDCRYFEGVYNAFIFCIEHSMIFQEVFGLEGKGSTLLRNVVNVYQSTRRKVLENVDLQENRSEELNLTKFNYWIFVVTKS
jgi:hypothetical protein